MHKILQQEWEYHISRNIPIWHDTLTIQFWLASRIFDQLPPISHIRIHRGFHTDFYFPAHGKLSGEEFRQALFKKFQDQSFIGRLETIYERECGCLLTEASQLLSREITLPLFFEGYGRKTALLDLTAIASKVITSHLIQLLEDVPQKEDVLAFYGMPLSPAPLQRFERDLGMAAKAGGDILDQARTLHEQYAWIPANFVGEPWNMDYFVERLRTHESPVTPSLKKPDTNLSEEQLYYLDLLGRITSLNEYRKEIFSLVSLIIRPYFQELALSHGLASWKDVGFLTASEVLDLSQGVKNDYASIAAYRAQHPCLFYGDAQGNVGIITGDDVKVFEEKFLPKGDGSGAVRGVVAHKGIVQGVARIILEPSDFAKMNAGDILVAKSTSVDFIPIMKKAGAFVTDEGGLASHAAIISREYGKPCVIGTKVATRTFRDGDFVEVDALKGTVKRM